MIEEPGLLTIRREVQRPTPAQVAAFQGVPTGFVVDAMQGGGSLDWDVCPLLPHGAVAGPALTVDCGPGDILAALAALPFVRPGDVVVSGFGGFQGCAAGGDRLMGMMKNNGAVGFVTDGPMRDLEGIEAVGLPVWCRGLTPASPFSTGPGRVGLPIQLAGQQVASGDMIVADRDGVVVVPFAEIDRIAARLEKVASLEAALDEEVADGLLVPEAVAALLESDQVTFE